jgi:membrane glycosyltransferase
VNSAVQMPPAQFAGGMPPEARLSMPSQDLSYSHRYLEPRRPKVAVVFARFILIAVSLGVTTYGVYQMLQVVRFASMTRLQGLKIILFAI